MEERSMFKSMMWLAVLAIALVTEGGCIAGKSMQQSNRCDRACLIEILDSYLSAVVKHDYSLAPLANDYRGTENAENVGTGEGHWKNISALGDVQRRYADPVSGQVGYVGLIREIDNDVSIASVRLRIKNLKVSEAEWIIARKGMALYNPKGFVVNQPLESHNPKTSFPDRAEAIRIVNSYFNGIEQSDGKHVIVHPECYRIENGTTTVGRKPEWPVRSPDHDEPGDGISGPLSELPQSNCISGFEYLRNTTEKVINRRFFIDEEAGMVWANAIFKRIEGGKTRKGEVLPWLYFNENFFIEDDHIRAIYVVMHYLPPEIEVSGWPDTSSH